MKPKDLITPDVFSKWRIVAGVLAFPALVYAIFLLILGIPFAFSARGLLGVAAEVTSLFLLFGAVATFIAYVVRYLSISLAYLNVSRRVKRLNERNPQRTVGRQRLLLVEAFARLDRKISDPSIDSMMGLIIFIVSLSCVGYYLGTSLPAILSYVVTLLSFLLVSLLLSQTHYASDVHSEYLRLSQQQRWAFRSNSSYLEKPRMKASNYDVGKWLLSASSQSDILRFGFNQPLLVLTLMGVTAAFIGDALANRALTREPISLSLIDGQEFCLRLAVQEEDLWILLDMNTGGVVVIPTSSILRIVAAAPQCRTESR